MAEKGKRKKIEKQIQEFVKFELPGDNISGKLLRQRQIDTQYGEAQILDIEVLDNDTGELKIQSVPLKSNLMYGYSWDEMIGKKVEIEYTGQQKNPKSGRVYKAFDVYELD